MSKYTDRILDLAENLSPTETAEAAGKLLEFVGCGRDMTVAFLNALGKANRDELVAHVTLLTPPPK